MPVSLYHPEYKGAACDVRTKALEQGHKFLLVAAVAEGSQPFVHQWYSFAEESGMLEFIETQQRQAKSGSGEFKPIAVYDPKNQENVIKYLLATKGSRKRHGLYGFFEGTPG